jgi:ParB-like nuclease domain
MVQQLDVLSKEPLHMAPDNTQASPIGAVQLSEGDMLAGLAVDEGSTPLVADPAQRRLESFDIDRIQVGGRTRALNNERLGTLVQSISTIGLRSPITVRIVPKMMVDGVEEEDVPALVAGLHRLEAVKKLGTKSIDCFVEPGSELDSQLWEIDENLCRAELTELERAEHLQKRQAIYERIHPESRQGGLPGAPGGGKAKTANLAGFAADTATKTGISERTVRRDARRANEIDRTVRDRIRDKPEIADSGVELDTLASMPAAEQKRVIDLVEAGRAGSVREAKKRLEEPEQAGHPKAGKLEAGEAEAAPPWLEAPRREEAGLQRAPPKAGCHRYPDIDPFKDDDPPWVNGALKLIPHLAEAIPAEATPNRDAIVRGALELILELTRFGGHLST